MASAQIEGPGILQADDRAAFAETVRRALYAGKIIAYAQGFSLMQDASERYGWNLDLGTIASIFRPDVSSRAVFLGDITKAYEADSNAGNLMFNPFFGNRINEYQDSLRCAVSTGVLNGLPFPPCPRPLPIWTPSAPRLRRQLNPGPAGLLRRAHLRAQRPARQLPPRMEDYR